MEAENAKRIRKSDGVPNEHKEWLDNNGLRNWWNDRPDFFRNCKATEDNYEKVCPFCSYKKQCDEYNAHFYDAIRHYNDIGEV